jgi:hypothetical protein
VTLFRAERASKLPTEVYELFVLSGREGLRLSEVMLQCRQST